MKREHFRPNNVTLPVLSTPTKIKPQCNAYYAQAQGIGQQCSLNNVSIRWYFTGRTVDAPSDGHKVRGDFPILSQLYPMSKQEGAGARSPLSQVTYLDSAATSQKPRQVLDAIQCYYETSNSNVHRGAHQLARLSTDAYESARDKVKTFIGASDRREIVFTRGATEAINLVANSWGDRFVEKGDDIVLTVMEHHSNLVPWQSLAQRRGATLKFARLKDDQSLDLEHLKSLLGHRTKLVACVHASNTLGCINPVKEICSAAHDVGAVVLVDACQTVPNMPVNVTDFDADFVVASAHKMCGPTGIGFLYGKHAILESMPPWQGGGEMIDEVTYERTTFASPPGRFEAGTPAIAQAVGLGAACDYLSGIGMHRVQKHDQQLVKYMWEKIKSVGNDLELLGPPPNADGSNRTPLVSFNSRTVHSLDVSFFMDQEGVAVRSGHHCTQPLHRLLGHSGSVRASCYLYSTEQDVDHMIHSLQSALGLMKSAGELYDGGFNSEGFLNSQL